MNAAVYFVIVSQLDGRFFTGFTPMVSHFSSIGYEYTKNPAEALKITNEDFARNLYAVLKSLHSGIKLVLVEETEVTRPHYHFEEVAR